MHMILIIPTNGEAINEDIILMPSSSVLLSIKLNSANIFGNSSTFPADNKYNDNRSNKLKKFCL